MSAVTLTQLVCDRVRSQVDDTGRTLEEVADSAGMNEATLVRTIHGARSFTVSELGNVCKALGVKVSELLTDAASQYVEQADATPKPQKERSHRPCARPGCTVSSHDWFDDEQADFCLLKGKQGPNRVWAVGALSNGPGDPWQAWVDVAGSLDGALEGRAGVETLRDALTAFESLQAECDRNNAEEAAA